MCMKEANGMKIIKNITNSILTYISTTPLYIKEISRESYSDFIKISETERDEKLHTHVNAYLDEFASKIGLKNNIVQYGMTFVKENRKEPYYFSSYIDSNFKDKFNKWIASYKDRNNIPIWMNELLCKHKVGKEWKDREEWKEYKFPMIILYSDNILYFIKTNGAYKALKMEEVNYKQIFKDNIDDNFKNDITKLHDIFIKEEYSKFKIFFTSNFRDMRSQTFIKFNKKLCNIYNKNELKEFINLCYLIDNVIGSVIYDFDLIINYHEYYGEILKHGTKSAMTAIMSRNLSHNIGSHVLSYWNQEIEEELEKVSKVSKSYNKDQTNLKKSKDLFQYIQLRMDFIAEVSTTIPSWEMSLDIKTDIIDPIFINPNRDKFENTSSSSILLSKIAKSEGVDLKNDNKIAIDINGMKGNTRVSIPHGYIGTHAIYAILENFIRNAAKHYKGGNKDSSPMIKIVVKEPNGIKWKNDYFVMRIWDMRENSCDFETVEKLRKFLPGSLEYAFTKEGELVSGGWGIKEMLTAANFLRKKKPEFLMTGIPKNEPPLLEILCGQDEKNGENCCKNENETLTCNREDSTYQNKLGIRLYLRKPKHLAIANSPTCKAEGEKFEIKKIDLQDTPLKEEIQHQMLLVNDDIKQKYEDDPKAPCRIISLQDIPQIEITSINDTCYLNLYEKFIEKLCCCTLDGRLLYLLDGENKFTSHKLVANTNNGLNQNVIVFCYHFDYFFCNGTYEEFESNYDKYYTKSDYLQPVSAGYSTKSKLDNLPEDTDLLTHFYLELIESALTKVVIVDERISDWSKQILFSRTDNGNETKVTIKEMLCKMKVYIADVKTENITCSDLTNELIAASEKGFNVFNNDNSQNNAHFFVIHQGILDKLNDAKDANKKAAKNFIDSIKCRKVVDSGRGVPTEELGEYGNVRFVEISALQKMLENYDKHALVQMLFSLRKPQK